MKCSWTLYFSAFWLFFLGTQHSSEFSRLIAQVRGHLEKSKRAPIKQEEEKSTEETDSKGPIVFSFSSDCT